MRTKVKLERISNMREYERKMEELVNLGYTLVGGPFLFEDQHDSGWYQVLTRDEA